MALDQVSLITINDRVAESAKKDETVLYEK